MPAIIVSPDGEFLRIGDVSKIREAMMEFIDTIKQKAPGASAPPNLMKLLENMTSEPVLTQLAAAEWQSFIGAFIGFTGKVGDRTEFDSEEPSPMVPGLNIPMRTTFALLRRAPCEAGRAPDSCVVMQVKSVVAPGAMQLVMKRLLEGVKEMQGLRYDRFDSTTEILTTLEPSVLGAIRHGLYAISLACLAACGSAAPPPVAPETEPREPSSEASGGGPEATSPEAGASAPPPAPAEIVPTFVIPVSAVARSVTSAARCVCVAGAAPTSAAAAPVLLSLLHWIAAP
jgi:hypothetical protein